MTHMRMLTKTGQISHWISMEMHQTYSVIHENAWHRSQKSSLAMPVLLNSVCNNLIFFARRGIPVDESRYVRNSGASLPYRAKKQIAQVCSEMLGSAALQQENKEV